MRAGRGPAAPDTMAESPGTPPDAEAPLVDAYLDHLRVSRRLASNSLEAYGRDLAQLAR